jgi:hypothetical protein
MRCSGADSPFGKGGENINTLIRKTKAALKEAAFNVILIP